MRITVRNILVSGALLGASLVGAEQASAMPIVPSVAAASHLQIEQAGWRCGPGWHVNPWGRCVPARRWGPRPMYRHYRRW